MTIFLMLGNLKATIAAHWSQHTVTIHQSNKARCIHLLLTTNKSNLQLHVYCVRPPSCVTILVHVRVGLLDQIAILYVNLTLAKTPDAIVVKHYLDYILQEVLGVL